MRKILILALLAVAFIIPALADSPHFVSATLDTSGLDSPTPSVTVTAREVGLGRMDETTIMASSRVFARYKCGKRGRVQLISKTVQTSQSFPDVRGQVQVSLTLAIPPATITCRNPNHTPVLGLSHFGPIIVLDSVTGASTDAMDLDGTPQGEK